MSIADGVLQSDVPAQGHANSPGMEQDAVKAKKPPLTHFLCLPLVTPQSRPELERNLQQFRNLVAPNRSKGTTQEHHDSDPTLPAKAIRPVGSLHLTLGVMSLSAAQLEQAKSDLDSLDITQLLSTAVPTVPSQPATSPLKVTLTSLHPMQSPHKTSILYASPHDPTARLLPFSHALRAHFTDKGHLIPDARPLKLHATIVNTIYVRGRDRTAYGAAKDAGGRGGKRSKAPLRFDASALVERYAGFEWAREVELDRVAICEMGAKEVRDEAGEVVDSVYVEVASVAICSSNGSSKDEGLDHRNH